MKYLRIYYIIFIALLTSYSIKVSCQTASFIHYGVEQGMVQSMAQSVVQDNLGNLWIGTTAGVSKYNGKSFQTYTKENGLAENFVQVIHKDHYGNIWFGHWGGGVSTYNNNLDQIEDLKFERISKFKPINDIFEDKKGNMWFATDGEGVHILNRNQYKFISISVGAGLSSNNVNDIYQDKSNNIWIGTSSGIDIIESEVLSNLMINDLDSNEIKGLLRDKLYHINQSNGLAGNYVTSIIQSKSNFMWIGTGRRGITVFKYQPPSAIEQANFITLGKKDGLADLEIRSLYEDNNGNIWIGSHSSGAMKYIPGKNEGEANDQLKGKFKIYSTDQGLNYNTVNEIIQDREGNMWIATDLGLNQYRGDRFQVYTESDGLASSYIWSIIQDRKGDMWYGTEHGLSKSVGDSFRNYTTKDGLGANWVLSIYEDQKGTLWFGTYGGGVSRLTNDKRKPFEVITEEDGLAGRAVFSIDGDNDGNIWFGTSKGVSKYNPTSSKFTNYTKDDGLGGNKIYRIYHDSKGNMWFGILGGALTMYDGNMFKQFGEKQGLKHRFILCITEDKTGIIWIGAYGGGLYKYDGNLFKNISVKDGLSSDSPFLLIANDNNNIWVGTSLGIDKYNQKTKEFRHYGKLEGFLGIETNQNAVCKDSDGNLWFGTIMGAVKYNPFEDKTNATEPITKITQLQIFRKDAQFPENGLFPYNQNHLTFRFIGTSLTNPKKVRYQYQLDGFDKDWLPVTEENYVTYSNLPFGKYVFIVKACNNDGIWNKEPVIYEFEVLTPYWRTWWFYSVCGVFLILMIYGILMYRIQSIANEKKVLEEKVNIRTQQLNEEKKKLEVAYVDLSKEKEKVDDAYKIIEEHNKHITDSIKYAKRIQLAILPSNLVIKKHLPQSFIYYRPKDIVSGDFYWFNHKKDLSVIAAVDCTGHGVPGAFMSLIGYTLLNQIVGEKEEFRPSKILTLLDEGVKEALRQKEEGAETMDGMDMGLATIDRRRQEVRYGGALRPLFVYRNGELEEFEGSRFSIGGYQIPRPHLYDDHMIKMKTGDTLYMFSDGLTDQFGGPRCKKFTKKRVKELLSECSNMPIEQQHDWVAKNMEEWKGNVEQTDDIMLIGVKF